MKFGKAYAIFANIDSPDYTDEESGGADGGGSEANDT